eukprot:scaffold1690_cov366-Prasinococcus_capsulatus_cf.AAC.9
MPPHLARARALCIPPSVVRHVASSRTPRGWYRPVGSGWDSRTWGQATTDSRRAAGRVWVMRPELHWGPPTDGGAAIYRECLGDTHGERRKKIDRAH